MHPEQNIIALKAKVDANKFILQVFLEETGSGLTLILVGLEFGTSKEA